MEKWQLETAERLASIESSIKYIEVNLSRLPPSPVCMSEHVRLDKEDEKVRRRLENLENFQKYITIRIAWVSGVFAALASGMISAFDSIRDFLFKVH